MTNTSAARSEDPARYRRYPSCGSLARIESQRLSQGSVRALLDTLEGLNREHARRLDRVVGELRRNACGDAEVESVGGNEASGKKGNRCSQYFQSEVTTRPSGHSAAGGAGWDTPDTESSLESEDVIQLRADGPQLFAGDGPQQHADGPQLCGEPRHSVKTQKSSVVSESPSIVTAPSWAETALMGVVPGTCPEQPQPEIAPKVVLPPSDDEMSGSEVGPRNRGSPGGQAERHTPTSACTKKTAKVECAKVTKRSPTLRSIASLRSSMSFRPGQEATRLQNFVHSSFFQISTAVLIVTNVVFIGWHAHVRIQAVLRHQGSQEGEGWMWCERVFCLLFLVELILRIGAYRRDFFRNREWRWNTFDVVLFMAGFVDIFMDSLGLNSSIPGSTSGRIVRIVRIIRTLRVVSLVKCFAKLRLMTHSVIRSMISLMWTLLLLFIIIFLFSIMILNGIISASEDGGPSTEVVISLQENYGTLPQVLLSLFMAITGGKDWHELIQPLLRLHVLYGIVFLVYMSFVVFGVLNVATAVFVDSALETSQMDREILIQEGIARKEAYMQELEEFFREADTDDSGTLTWPEFEVHACDGKVQAYLSSMGLEISEAIELFKLMDIQGTGEVAIEDFVVGCTRLKGAARSIDVCTLLMETRRLSQQLETMNPSQATPIVQIKGGFARQISGESSNSRCRQPLLRTPMWDSDRLNFPALDRPLSPRARNTPRAVSMETYSHV